MTFSLNFVVKYGSQVMQLTNEYQHNNYTDEEYDHTRHEHIDDVDTETFSIVDSKGVENERVGHEENTI